MKHKPCLNCGHSVYEKYCPNCGQKGDTHRINWHYLWHDIPHSIFHLDKGFFKTMRDLAVNPGEMIRSFLDGKRATYFRPIMYLLITGSMAGLIYLNVPMDSLLARDEETMNLVHEIQRLQSKYINVISIGLIPIQAFIAWLFYRKERNYVEIMTSQFFMVGQLNLLAVISLFYFIPMPKMIVFGISGLVGLLSSAYTIWVYTTMFNSRPMVWRLIIAFVLWILQGIFNLIVVMTALLIYMASQSPDGSININYGF